jgi:acyl-CoA thioester hydrolase
VATSPFIHREVVRFGDLDAMRHLNNVSFLRYFETARISFIRQLLPEQDMANPDSSSGFGVILAELHIDYRSPGVIDDEVDISCSIGEVRRSSFQILFEMHVGERMLAEGYGWMVAFDYATQKSMRLPEDIRERLQ